MKSNKLFRYLLLLAIIVVVFLVVGKKKGWVGKEFKIKVAVKKFSYGYC